MWPILSHAPKPAPTPHPSIPSMVAVNLPALPPLPSSMSVVPDLTSLSQYMGAVGRYDVLNPEEERALARRKCDGDDEARKALVLHNLRFVITQAKKYQAPGIDFVDLIQAGNEGLIKAVDRFDPDRKVRLISYASYWINQSIRVWLTQHSHVCGLPVNRGTEANRIRRARNELAGELDRQPTVQEVADRADVTPEIVRVIGRLEHPTSLDSSMGDDSDSNPSTLGERIPSSDDLEADVEAQSVRASLEDVVDQALPERLARIIRLRFGLGFARDYTLEEIGQIEGVSRERIRQLRDQALEHLREEADPVVLDDCRATLMS